jgi:hypothetical protein
MEKRAAMFESIEKLSAAIELLDTVDEDEATPEFHKHRIQECINYLQYELALEEIREFIQEEEESEIV